METEDTSGYSSIQSSPQSSDEDLLKHFRRTKIQLELKPRDPLKEKPLDNLENTKRDEEVTEEEVDYRPIVTPDEIEPHREWYHKLVMFRWEFRRDERGAFPPFPPPPLPSALIAASMAISVSSFEEAKRIASINTFQSKSPATVSLEKREHRFRPADFRPLPPPHVYLEMIKTLAPHQYIDLTYALAGAVLLELGFRVPEHYPPLPPKIEPFRDLEAEERAHMTEASSQSSSEGEYSDASENSRSIEKLKRRKNLERRAAREVRIAAKILSTKGGSLREFKNGEEPKRETFSRDSIYKEKTLSTFISRPINRRPPLPMPPFFCPPPIPHNERALPPPPFPLPQTFPFAPFPLNHQTMWCLPPFPFLSPPETPSSSFHDDGHYRRKLEKDSPVSVKG